MGIGKVVYSKDHMGLHRQVEDAVVYKVLAKALTLEDQAKDHTVLVPALEEPEQIGQCKKHNSPLHFLKALILSYYIYDMV